MHFRVLGIHVIAGAAGGIALGCALAIMSVVASRSEFVRFLVLGYAGLTTFAYIVSRGNLRSPLLPLLERSAQVSPRWTMPGASWIWGFELGLGVATYVITPLIHVMLVCALFLGGRGAFFVGVIYGMSRSLANAMGATQLRRSDQNNRGIGLRQALMVPASVFALLALIPTTVLALSGGS